MNNKSVFLIFALFCVLACTQIATSDFSTELQKCHYSDSECLTQTAQQIVDKYAVKGSRELNLIPFAPLHLNTLQLERNPNSPVNIELKFKDIDIIGLQDTKMLKVKGFDSELKENVELEVMVPKLILKGPYSIDGRVLILPIVGKGDSEIQLENTLIPVKVKTKPVKQSGNTYLQVDNIKLTLKPKKVNIKFTGLFNGNKELGDNMNVFINENWKEIFGELQPEISKALGLILKEIVNNVFSKNPYDKYFQ